MCVFENADRKSQEVQSKGLGLSFNHDVISLNIALDWMLILN